MSLEFRISPAYCVYYSSQLSFKVFGMGKSQHIAGCKICVTFG